MHDEHRQDPALAFALSRLSFAPTMPTPMGVFRDVTRPPTRPGAASGDERGPKQGPGDLKKLISSGATWTVE
ncbi:MAG: hypothetical protein U0W40_07880 [Acidimicrobiia bacterium]